MIASISGLRRGGASVLSACVALCARFNRAAALALALMAAPALGDDAAAPVTLVAFGDSLIHGYGLPAEDGFVPQLQAWLDANGAGPVAVVNAGVSGDTTSGGLARLDWSIGAEADAVILELGANDALRGVDPAITRANLDAMLTRLAERALPTLLVGMMAPRNWGPEYVEAFEPIYPELAAKHDAPLYPFMLEGLVGERALFQPDGLHPNAEGVRILVALMGPAVKDLVERARAAARS